MLSKIARAAGASVGSSSVSRTPAAAAWRSHAAPAVGMTLGSGTSSSGSGSSSSSTSMRWLSTQHQEPHPSPVDVKAAAASDLASPSMLHSKDLPVTFVDVGAAAFRIRQGVPATTCKLSPALSRISNCKVYAKKEFRLPTGSFKERGARNALMCLDRESAKKGVIAASAGNHALALCYHGKQLGIPVTVVMPKIAPLTKIANCRELGANVMIEGSHIGEARLYATRLGQEQGLQYINGYDDPRIIAGAGTLGLELLEQVPEIDAIVVPVGGGGLIAGVALAIKSLRPEVLVIGVEPSRVPSMTMAMQMGHTVEVAVGGTLADGLAVPKVGDNAFAITRRYADKIVCVEEQYIALAMLRVLEMEKNMVEGAGAAGLAALLQGLLPELDGKNVCVPLCGGNVDVPVLGRVIERGLAVDGRLIRFSVEVSDRPGGLAGLTAMLAKVGANVQEIHHERAFVVNDVAKVSVRVMCETIGPEHSKAVKAALEESGYSFVWAV